jgi:uncharacterized membrane protein YoaK (UPF0700 family)
VKVGGRTDPSAAIATMNRANDHVRLRVGLIVSLTVVTGMTDVIAFTRLGGVFTSVMTGNMVLMGLSVGQGDLSGLQHAAVAVIAYVIGVMAGGRLSGVSRDDDPIWPVQVTAALLAEFTLLLALNITWWCQNAHVGSDERTVLLVVATLAMGAQSSAVMRLNLSGLSSTFLTGTLTSVARAVAHRNFTGTGRPALVLLALPVGAAIGGVLSKETPVLATAPPLLILAVILIVARTRLHRPAPPTF